MQKRSKKAAKRLHANGPTEKSQKASTAVVANRKERRSFEITDRGISSLDDLMAFFSAVTTDINSGNMDLKEAASMSSFTGKLLGAANLKQRLGLLAVGTKRAQAVPLLNA